MDTNTTALDITGATPEPTVATPTEKHPELRALLDSLQAEKATITAQTAPLHAEYDALAAQIAPLEEKQRAVADQFIALERPRLGEIDNQISALARALGAKRMSDGATTA